MQAVPLSFVPISAPAPQTDRPPREPEARGALIETIRNEHWLSDGGAIWVASREPLWARSHPLLTLNVTVELIKCRRSLFAAAAWLAIRVGHADRLTHSRGRTGGVQRRSRQERKGQSNENERGTNKRFFLELDFARAARTEAAVAAAAAFVVVLQS